MRGYFFFRPLIVILAFPDAAAGIRQLQFPGAKAQAAIVDYPDCSTEFAFRPAATLSSSSLLGPDQRNGPPTSGFVSNILAFENDSVKQYLGPRSSAQRGSRRCVRLPVWPDGSAYGIRAWNGTSCPNDRHRLPACRQPIDHRNQRLQLVRQRLWQHEGYTMSRTRSTTATPGKATGAATRSIPMSPAFSAFTTSRASERSSSTPRRIKIISLPPRRKSSTTTF